MPPIAYTVVAHCPSADLAAEYLAWLAPGHTDLVLRAGASEARVVRLDHPDHPHAPGRSIETHYIFPDRGAFDRYLAESAPALRADGLARFPPALGIRFERRSGEVV